MIQNFQNRWEEEEETVDNNNASTPKETIYVFDLKEAEEIKAIMLPKIRTKLWQIFPSICASLTCIPFGLMLGWPAITYPLLLSATESPIPITMDQSAMIAGFLMLGVVLGTLFSTKQVANGPKYGIILANFFIFIGWIIMWKATNIYGLLSSRLIIGTGHGYGMGQIKNYIKEMTNVELATILIKFLNLFGIFGFLLAYLVGPFIDFMQYSFSCVILSLLILFLVTLLPATPSELIQANKIAEAKKLLIFLKPDMNAENELNKVCGKIMAQEDDAAEFNGFTKLMRNRSLRVNFIKLTILLIIQQYAGLAPTLIYTQILFEKSNVAFPEFISMGYSVLFFLSTLIGTFVTPKYNKKMVLLASSITILISFILKIIVIYYKINLKYFNYSSVIIMYFFLVIHTIGLGSIPFTLINDWFPKSYRTFVTNYFIILFSLLALTITKIFQVLITQFPFYIPFYLFSGVILFGIIFIALFIPNDLSIALEGFYQENTKNCIEISIKK